MKSYEVSTIEKDKAAGNLYLEMADVEWFLSVDSNDLQWEHEEEGVPSYRSITVDGDLIKLDDAFERGSQMGRCIESVSVLAGLHTEVYRDILHGGGFGLADARSSIELVYNLSVM